MKKFLFLSVGAFISLNFLISCSAITGGETEASEDVAEAIGEGREAAKRLINTTWKDTMELQKVFLEVRSQQSKYEIEGHPHLAEVFDSAFMNTIRVVRPDLAKQLE